MVFGLVVADAVFIGFLGVAWSGRGETTPDPPESNRLGRFLTQLPPGLAEVRGMPRQTLLLVVLSALWFANALVLGALALRERRPRGAGQFLALPRSFSE